ncbi:hypothetical protein NBH00_23910 [Paraconexibacter antarcticus]|uniref:DUF4142 domain-containing protein n=1 Tax=Paraconexibacter antarcticus TaxID=2949664 RepID=A0ABY5DQR1_9ACTN|nr:hypothetical protein [Paraconexibacter antarcticus]UTI64370.1 hypothetical protein NBH00_23910 [Paraconexibacter antarcticus]
MRKSSLMCVAAAAALAVPAAASAADVQTGVDAATSHTAKADSALTHALTLFKGGDVTRGTAAFTASRKEMGLARSAAAQARHAARTAADRALAADAQADVAGQQDTNIVKLATLLPRTHGTVQNQVAQAALADTKGRDKALAVLAAVALTAPAQAQSGLAHAVQALSTDRSSEITADAKALVSDAVTPSNKQTLAAAVKPDVSGQTTAADKLKELLGAASTPDAAKPGLAKAYDAVTTEHGTLADILSRFSDRMPASVRSFVTSIVTNARTDARTMHNDRPAPPTATTPPTAPSHPTGKPVS